MCRQTLSKRLHARYLEAKEKLVVHLMTLKAVCTTADCWSARGKSYVGVTCHWIDPKKLKRISVCLAIRKFFGRHTYDLLGKTLLSINMEFGIDDITVLTLTDSGSNFLKAFRLFGVHET